MTDPAPPPHHVAVPESSALGPSTAAAVESVDPAIRTNGSPNDSPLEKGVGEPPPRPAYTAFSPGRRRLILGIVTAGGFLGPLSMGIYLPAIPILARVFNASITEINATISVFMVVLAVAPLFWASYADYGGRKTLYMISIPIYTISNILMAALPANIAALFILRIVQAFGAASVISLAAGTVADITEPKRRASAMSIVLLGPQGGPVLGPILGGALVSANWRWIFGFLAIASFVIFLLLVFCLPETLRSLVGNGSVYAESSWVTRPQFRQPCVVDSSKFPKPPRPTLIGLFKLLREPPLLFLSLNSALLFAAYYAMNVTLSPFLQTEYGFSAAEAGVAYLAPGGALVIGSLVSGRVSDLYRAGITKRHPEGHLPLESRLHFQIPGILLFMSGIAMYGWFADRHVHVAGLLAATAIAGFGMTWVFITTTTFLTEYGKTQPATLVALAGLVRNPAAAVAAAVVDPLMRRMGTGWCFTGLSLVELFCVVSVLFLIFGKSYAQTQPSKPGAPRSGP